MIPTLLAISALVCLGIRALIAIIIVTMDDDDHDQWPFL